MLKVFGQRWFLMVLATAGVVGIQLWNQPVPATGHARAADKNEAPGLTPYDIPDGDTEKLFQFFEELTQEKKDFATAEAQREDQYRMMLTGIAIADRILAQEKLSDADAEKAAQLKTQGLVNLAMLKAPNGAKNAVAAVQAMTKDPRPILVQFARNNEQLVRIICVGGLPPEDRDALMTELLAEVKKRKFAQRVLNRAQMLGESLEEAGDRDRVFEYYGQLAAAMHDSGIENLIGQAKRIEGQLRRMKLPGNNMEIAGTTLDGDKFDWKALRGKVVLVDFWATWCGPCRAELPNIKKNYKKYHEQGFEVVGISLDEDQDLLVKFLDDQKIGWVTLFEPEESKRGWQTPLAEHYGISGIPMAILVDREGKVISMSARGPELTRLLEEQFPAKE